MEDFIAFKLRFGACGVYLLLHKGQVVYAGKSVNVFARIGVHHQTMQRKRRGLGAYLNNAYSVAAMTVVFDEVRVKPCAKADLDKEELALIQRYLPPRNVLHNRPLPKVDLTMLPGFQHLLKSGRTQPKFKPRKLAPLPTPVTRSRGITLPKLKCLEEAV